MLFTLLLMMNISEELTSITKIQISRIDLLVSTYNDNRNLAECVIALAVASWFIHFEFHFANQSCSTIRFKTADGI